MFTSQTSIIISSIFAIVIIFKFFVLAIELSIKVLKKV